MITNQSKKIVLVALFIMATGNLSLFQRILEVYPLTLGNAPFLLSLVIFFTLSTAIVLLVICHRRLGDWILAFYLIASSLAAYYMDKFGVVIDSGMIENILQTNPQELSELISGELALRTIILGIIPAWIVIRIRPKLHGFLLEARSQLILVLAFVLLLIMAAIPFTASYASFIREHKSVRFYANPTYFTYSAYRYTAQHFVISARAPLQHVAQDARHLEKELKNELVILVVGETARADRFSLNGYHRETNPELQKEDLVSFTNVTACGTSTAVSVPCMFSAQGKAGSDGNTIQDYENVLDVLVEHGGVQILWRDNNSDSKGVAARIPYENFRNPAFNPVCDEECRDVGMLSGLDEYIQARKGQDILIILHQMGNHGPAYYKRYPKDFEKLTPVCKGSNLGNCTTEEISNAYDNAILYTDYFLSQVIGLLKKYDNQFETAMLYVGDHGESLGENGIYLHGAPYIFSPKEQVHIPVILWVGQQSDFGLETFRPYRNLPLSHDQLFCALLISFEIGTQACNSANSFLFKNKDPKLILDNDVG